MKYYLAIDIGASSGRHIIGWRENERICTREIYRFPNGVKEENGHLIWDVNYLFNEVKEGIKKCFSLYPEIESLSIDTWGVEYVLLDGDKEILPVYAYRDSRTKESIEQVHSLISFDELYEISGCQFQEFNTIYQLYWDKLHNRLDRASDFLMIPEYLMYKLTGVKAHEYTNASTTGLTSLKSKTYSKTILKRLGLEEKLFFSLDKPKTVLGSLRPNVVKEVGGNLKVVLCATHDTASAVEGIDMKKGAPYISSGTWSLLGVKHPEGVNGKEAFLANYSNEYGPDYVRLQKNIMGLWIIQGLAKQFHLDFPTMVNMAKQSDFKEIFDLNDSVFFAAMDMKETIKEWFVSRGLSSPKEDADYINSAYHSLAYSYHVALEELEMITKKKYDDIYIVGGGAKNEYLNDLSQKYTNKNIVALPIEATAIGNLKVQMEQK